MLDIIPSSARSRWSAERSALLTDVLRCGDRSGQRVRLRVHGESMLPTLWPGDVVEIVSCSLDDVRPGQILLAQREGRLYLHRLIACAPNGFVLRGDSLPGPDPQFTSKALLGRLVRRVQHPAPNNGPSDLDELAVLPKRHPDTKRSFRGACASSLHIGAKWLSAKSSRAVGILLCHCAVARSLALKLHSKSKSSAREFRNSENAAELRTL
jgi:hypothetical protein